QPSGQAVGLAARGAGLGSGLTGRLLRLARLEHADRERMLARAAALLVVGADAGPVAAGHLEYPVPLARLALRLDPGARRVARLDGAQRDDARGAVPADAPLGLLGLEVGQRFA